MECAAYPQPLLQVSALPLTRGVTVTKPEPIVRSTDRSKFTMTPVASRAGKLHPWRSYTAGNSRYKRDFERHFYTTETIDGVEVLCTVTVEPVGTLVETHCY